MVAETATMPRKKTKPPNNPKAGDGSEQYRKPHKMVRIRLRLAEAAESAILDLEQDLTQFVNDALRERLERMGRWPPKDEPKPCPAPRP